MLQIFAASMGYYAHVPRLISLCMCEQFGGWLPQTIERFHRGRGLFLLLAVATGFYMLKVPNWESLHPKY